MLTSYRDLRVWQSAMTLVTQTYRLTATLPKSEVYGLSSQIRRSAVSVPSNIAEGHARASTKEYVHFVGIALASLASLAELETQLLIARRLELASIQRIDELLARADEVGKMLRGLEMALAPGLRRRSLAPSP